MIVLKFIWYCLKCMFDLFIAASGYAPEGYTWKQTFIGVITLIVIIALVLCVLLLMGGRFKK